MRKIFVTLLLVLNIFSASLASAYHVDKVVKYAKDHYIKYNPNYDKFEKVDCANFVSQCLIAGSLKLNESEVIKKLKIPNDHIRKGGTLYNCDSLGKYIKEKGAKHSKISKIADVPGDLGLGDVVIFQSKTDESSWHAVIIISGQGKNAIYAAHTSNRKNGKLSWYLNNKQNWDAHIYLMSSIKSPEPAIKMGGIDISKLKKGQGVIVGRTVSESNNHWIKENGESRATRGVDYIVKYKILLSNVNIRGVEFNQKGIDLLNPTALHLRADITYDFGGSDMRKYKFNPILLETTGAGIFFKKPEYGYNDKNGSTIKVINRVI
jgi:Putative amidase domain